MHWARGVTDWTAWVTAAVLLAWLRRTSCENFHILLNATAKVDMKVHLGDRVTIICPQDRYDNILYLRTEEQLLHCNASALPASYTATHLLPYINVGACVGPSVPSFNIDIKRTSVFLATAVPFEKGHTYHFTSFTNGSAVSAAAKPTAGGDCTRGLSLVFRVIDPHKPQPPVVTTTTSSVDPALAPTPSPTPGPGARKNPSVGTVQALGLSSGSSPHHGPLMFLLISLCALSLFSSSSLSVSL